LHCSARRHGRGRRSKGKSLRVDRCRTRLGTSRRRTTRTEQRPYPDGSLKRPDISIFCHEPEEQDDAISLVPEAMIEVVSRGYEAKDLEIGPGSISRYLVSPEASAIGAREYGAPNPRSCEVRRMSCTAFRLQRSINRSRLPLCLTPMSDPPRPAPVVAGFISHGRLGCGRLGRADELPDRLVELGHLDRLLA
jgi:hypothetical protein